MAVSLWVVSTGCASIRADREKAPTARIRREVPPSQPIDREPPKDVPEEEHVAESYAQPHVSTLTKEQKAQFVRQAKIDLLGTLVMTREVLKLQDREELSDVCRQELAGRLADINMRVFASSDWPGYDVTPDQLEEYGRASNADLVIVAKAVSEKADRLGDFWSFRARIAAKALRAFTGDVVASKRIEVRGRRALTEDDAARSALTRGAKQAVNYLADEILRKHPTLISLHMVVDNMTKGRHVDTFARGLEKRPGITYVSLESWDDESCEAVFEVACRSDVREDLRVYVEKLEAICVEIYTSEKGLIRAHRK